MAAVCSGVRRFSNMKMATKFLIALLFLLAIITITHTVNGAKLNPKVPKDRQEIAAREGTNRVKQAQDKDSSNTVDKPVDKKTQKPKEEVKEAKKATQKLKKPVTDVPDEQHNIAKGKDVVREHEKGEDHEKEEEHEKEEDREKEEEHENNPDEETEHGGKDEDDLHKQRKKSNKKIKKVLTHKDGKGKPFKLSSHPACAANVDELCEHIPKGNNFAVLSCLQDNAVADDDKVADECHQILWEYKRNLTMDTRFDKAAFELCQKSIKKHENCNKEFKQDGSLVNCLVEHKELIKENKCRNFVQKMARIVFSDYRLIKGFYEDCHTDVNKFKCGRISEEDKDSPELHKQGETIECLEEHLESLSEGCRKQVNRVAELSSDDYHMDRALFYACQDARERFCGEVQSGNGRIYKCLMKHMDEETMASDCKQKLEVREKMMAENVKVNYPLWEHCGKDAKKYECAGGSTDHGRAAALLLCLNEAISSGKSVDPQCQAEMQDFGAQLFQDYKLNPEIVSSCEHELHNNCSNEFQPNGAAVDCLMGLMKDNELSETCAVAVDKLLRETGAGSHYTVDRPLYLACDSVIEVLCKDKKEAMVLGCLMDNIYSETMTPKCQTEIFHLQYFLARDFRLDQKLYLDCKDDAEKLCSAQSFSEDSINMPPGIVLACLYRSSFETVEKAHRVSKQCSAHVRRVMHQRAQSVKLMPEIEQACMKELGDVCLEKTKEGEEVDCLQQHYDKLGEKCRGAIANFTELESEDMELDKDLVHACSPMVAKFCQSVIEKGDSENVLSCLIENKNHADMSPTCQVAIEHWQLIEMKDFKFSHNLKKACYDDVMNHCQNEETKFDAVKCLSAIIKSDTVKNKPQRISKECRSQIHEELKIQSEDMKLNPDLLDNCKNDIEKLCKDVRLSQAEAEECLRSKRKQLSKPCEEHLFQQELMESKDNELDYQLMHICKPMIKIFCNDEPMDQILRCLRKYKNDVQMENSCRKLIVERQVEETQQVALDADLAEFCERDVNEHCKGVRDQGRGEIINCLRKQIEKETLSPECEDLVRTRQEEAALDYRLDPALEDSCRQEIPRICADVEPGRGNVVECLKKNFQNILSKSCKEEVARLLSEGEEDIHADPQLIKKCAVDVKHFCANIQRGHGNTVKCLMDVYTAKTLRLSGVCHTFLAERIALWKVVGTGVHFGGLSEIAMAVHASPERNYIYVVSGCILGAIFIGGLCFGRVTKRVSQAYKDR